MVICSPVIIVKWFVIPDIVESHSWSHLHACANTNRQYFTQMYLQASRLNETYCLLLKVYNSELWMSLIHDQFLSRLPVLGTCVFALAINHCSRGARLMWFTCLLWNCSLPPKDSSTWIVLRKRRLAIFYGAPLFAIRSVNITQKLFKFSFIVQFQKILSILPPQKDCFFQGKNVLKPQKF